MSRDGDWMCAACQHVNFKKRDACQRCSYVLAGDWYCRAMNCGSHNYASRSSCYLCGVIYDASALPGWKSGGWICSRLGCAMHNYASRAECYKCKTPRNFGELSAM
ncbi:unnamed protein product [Withania somnifera]